MCLQKVYVKDRYKQSLGNYYPCGHCSSCQQAKANSRQVKIRNTYPVGTNCYFVTLNYRDDSIPYILKSQLHDALPMLIDSPRELLLPIYRDCAFRYSKKDKKFIRYPGRTQLTEFRLSSEYNLADINSLRGVTVNHNKVSTEDADRVSVAYSIDIRNFIKRFRENMFYDYKTRPLRHYFFAPEYGPTTQRFHVHLLLWIDKRFTLEQVAYYIRKAWPFEDFERFEANNGAERHKYCDNAVNPSSYVASYVNCSSNVSKFLQKIRPLRPSHSLGFGFDSIDFSLREVLNSYSRQSFTYHSVRVGKDGKLVPSDILYPKHVIYRYFPKLKGFNRFTTDALRLIYTNPAKYLQISVSKQVNSDYSNVAYFTTKGLPMYNSSAIDVYGRCLPIDEKYSRQFSNRLSKTYNLYWRPLGYCYSDFVKTVINYLNGRSRFLYFESVTNKDYDESCRQFFNLRDLITKNVENYSFADFISHNPYVNENCVSDETSRDLYLSMKFNLNIKQRKLHVVS